MNIFQQAALVALTLVPAISAAQDGNDAGETPDEIVVVGRSITTTSTRVEVSREMLVDSALVLKDIPGANVNSNGMITGIAQ